MGKIEFINPVAFSNWNDLVLQNEKYSVFHSKEWCQLLNETYSYKPYYLTGFNGNSFDFMVPYMEVKSILTGSRLVSLPFSDYCEPIINNNFNPENIISTIKNIRKNSGLIYMDIRGGESFLKSEEIYSKGYVHKLSLNQGEDDLYAGLKSSNKRNIKKAKNEGVQIRFSNDYGSIVDFYKLNIITRQRHGIPPQPFQIF